jgi:hypothetical protein
MQGKGGVDFEIGLYQSKYQDYNKLQVYPGTHIKPGRILHLTLNIMSYNSHIHTFTEANVPKKFLPLGLVKRLAERNNVRTLPRGLNW